jgi:ubiquinone/menaquinone biosynthesis C-methylase UbiE
MKNQILSGKQFHNTDEAALHYLKKTELLPKGKIAFDFISPTAKILDLGCGTGRTTVYFRKGIYL